MADGAAIDARLKRPIPNQLSAHLPSRRYHRIAFGLIQSPGNSEEEMDLATLGSNSQSIQLNSIESNQLGGGKTRRVVAAGFMPSQIQYKSILNKQHKTEIRDA